MGCPGTACLAIGNPTRDTVCPLPGKHTLCSSRASLPLRDLFPDVALRTPKILLASDAPCQRHPLGRSSVPLGGFSPQDQEAGASRGRNTGSDHSLHHQRCLIRSHRELAQQSPAPWVRPVQMKETMPSGIGGAGSSGREPAAGRHTPPRFATSASPEIKGKFLQNGRRSLSWKLGLESNITVQIIKTDPFGGNFSIPY